MLSRMDPFLPPEKRTLHLLKTPDTLCANDMVYTFVVEVVNPFETPFETVARVCSHMVGSGKS
jgi:hypothetical protein